MPVTQESQPATRVGRTIAYGRDPLQTLDFWRASAKGPAPLIIFVHGGGFQQGDKADASSRSMIENYPRQGYAFASINYRLVPGATVEQASQDVADAVKSLIDRSEELGVDRRKIIVMGHGAGGNLVSLVGTSSRYLKAAGLSFDDIAGIVAIDCALYDIPVRMLDEGPPQMHEMYQTAFGTQPERQRSLSPALEAVRPNVGSFLLLSNQGTAGEVQAHLFYRALRASGNKVEEKAFRAGEGLLGHDEIIRKLGDPQYAATAALGEWLTALFGK